MAHQLDGHLADASTHLSPSVPHRITWDVSLAGRFTMDALRPGMFGRVIAVFRRCFYVETAGSDILCVASTALAPGPLNLLCDFSEEIDWCFLGLQRGDSTHSSGDALAIGDHWNAQLEKARTWTPQAIRFPVQTEVLARGLDALRSLRRDFANGDLPAAVHMASERPITDLREWLVYSLAHGAAAGQPPSSIRGLLGLGPGLTPSGDDFLGGVMLALIALGYRSFARPIEVLVLASARDRTNAISAAHLRCAAHGEGSAAIHGLLAAVCRQGKRSIGSSVTAVDQIGHTSGWDTVVGIELALSAVLEDALERQLPVVGGFPGN